MAYTFKKDVTFTPSIASGFCTALFELKSALTGAGWSVIKSGTGVNSASYSDSGDIILSASQLNGAQNAWFVIKMSGSNRSWSFQRGTVDYNWRVKFAPGGFTGVSPLGTIATGSYNSTPAGPTEVILLGTNTDASPTYASFPTPSAIGMRAQIIADNAPPYGACMIVHDTGTGAKECMWFVDPMIAGTYGASDADPYVYGIHPNSANSGLNNLFSAESTPQYAILTGSIPYLIIAPDYCVFDNSNMQTVIPGGLPTNPITNLDDVFAVTWVRRGAQSNIGGQKGISSLFLWTGTNRAVGSTYSIASTSDYYIFGHIAFPWDGSTPSI
jgi:hypothetical protein